MKGRSTQHQRGLAENRPPRPLWLVVMAITALGAFAACSDVSFQIVPCKRDTDCKFDRICDRDLQACVFPLTKSPTDPSVGSGSVPPMNTGSGGAAAVGSGGGQTTGPSASVSSVTTTSASSGPGGSGGAPPDPECTLPSDCPGADSTCGYRTCIQQMCGFAYAPLGTPCSDGGGDSCNGAGQCIVTDAWTALSAAAAPTPRYGHTAVWTGTEMIVWGGRQAGNVVSNGGARYNPLSDTWTPVSTVGAPAARYGHTAVWTGTEMIVWGGYSTDFERTGGKYNPTTNTWSPMTLSGAPSKRIDHSMVWTGSQVIIWGGRLAGPPALGNGARYNPTQNTWSPMSGAGAPKRRFSHTAIWTGTRVIIWSGFDFFDWFNTGAFYDPVSNTWLATSMGGALPKFRMDAESVWTGDRMLSWGGWDGGYYLDDGGQFTAKQGTTGTWSTLPGSSAPSGRAHHVAMWTGTSGLFVWGGCGTDTCIKHYDDGAVWKQGNWTTVKSSPLLNARRDHTGVFTGSEIIVWGGRDTTLDKLFGDGARRQIP